MQLTREQMESCKFIVQNFLKADNFFDKYGEKYGQYRECIIKNESEEDGHLYLKGVFKFVNEEGKVKSKQFHFKFYYGTSGQIWDNKMYLRGGGDISIKNDTLRLRFLHVKEQNHYECHVETYKNFSHRYKVDSKTGLKLEKK